MTHQLQNLFSVIPLSLEVDLNAVTSIADVRHIVMKLFWRLVTLCYMHYLNDVLYNN